MMAAVRNGAARTRRRPLIGAQIRRLRTDRGLTLAQVSEATGLNVGYLSQVETDKASPSLGTLAGLADAFGVPIAWLLVDAVPPPKVVRAGERPAWQRRDGGRTEEVDGGLARTLRIIEVVAPPGMKAPIHADTGEEHHLVLEGRFRLAQGQHEIELGPGDYLVWDGSYPHEAENIGEGTARILIVTPGPIAVSLTDGRATPLCPPLPDPS